MPAAQSVGFFGKLPSAGDFVQRRLPQAFVDRWDADFAQAVAASRELMGDSDWRAAYRSGPAWRFVLAAQICGPSAWQGILGPGTDRTGRCFPMVIACPLPADAIVPALADPGWFDAAEQVYAASQHAALSVPAFDEAVVNLGRGFDVPDTLDLPEAPLRIAPPSYAGLLGAHLRTTWAQLQATGSAGCLWWTGGGGCVPASILVTAGLPDSAAYCAFIDAGQTAGDWHTLGEFPESPTRSSNNIDDAANVATAPAPLLDAPAQAVPSPLADTTLDDITALLGDSVPATTEPVVSCANDAIAGDERIGTAVVMHREGCNLTLVAANCNGQTGDNVGARIAEAGRQLPGEDLRGGLQALREQLLLLHTSLRGQPRGTADETAVDCAVIALKHTDAQASVLRVGAADAWLFRQGQLEPLMKAQANTSPPGDLDDLLFGTAPAPASGLGASADPVFDEINRPLEAGDRVLLAATPQLLQLPPATLVRGLSMPSTDEARRHIAAAAGLGVDREWPLAVIQV